MWHVLWQRRLRISHLSTKNQLPQLSQPGNKVPPKRHWLHARDIEKVLNELCEGKELLCLGFPKTKIKKIIFKRQELT